MNRKAIVLVLLLAAADLTLRIRGDRDLIVPSLPLQDLPLTIGQWQGEDVPMEPRVLEVLGDGKFLDRSYSRLEGTGSATPIDLLIAYFPSQRTGQTIHSRKTACRARAGRSSQEAASI